MAGELIARSVRQALAVLPADLSESVTAKAKLCLADALRCMFEARDLPTSRQALAAVQPIVGATPIAATALSATIGEAAFAMATLSAGLLREDMHAASISHHGIVVWPTLLALAHASEVDGARFLAAGVIGYELGARLGAALFDAELARRFRPTAFCATAGAAMAGAYMLGFDETAAIAAVALAVDAASGLNQWPWTGGDEIFFQAGRAAQHAVTAVALARAGAFASPSLLDGEAGVFASLKRPCPADLALFAAEPAILAVYNKPLPICNFAQTAGQAALAIAAERRFAPGEIIAVAAAVTEAARLYPGCDHTGGYDRALQAKMSIRFAVAAALVHGDLAEARFHPPHDAETLRLAGLCTLTVDPALTAAFPGRQGASVTVRLESGETLDAARGDVTPASEAVVRAGLLAEAGVTLGHARAKTLLMAIDGLDAAPRAGGLLTLARAGRAHPAAA